MLKYRLDHLTLQIRKIINPLEYEILKLTPPNGHSSEVISAPKAIQLLKPHHNRR